MSRSDRSDCPRSLIPAVHDGHRVMNRVLDAYTIEAYNVYQRGLGDMEGPRAGE